MLIRDCVHSGVFPFGIVSIRDRVFSVSCTGSYQDLPFAAECTTLRRKRTKDLCVGERFKSNVSI